MAEDEGPPDPQLDPERSPGFGTDQVGLEDIEVDRDVTIGEATPEELTASDTAPFDDAPVSALVAQLSEGTAIQRRRSALALADREVDGTAVSALATAAQADADADVRQFAVEALGQLAVDGANDVAVAVTGDDDPWVRAEAFVALDRLDRARHEDRLADGLNDPHHAVRRNAAISLFKVRGEAMLPDLLDLMADPSDRVREWAAHMLGGIDNDRARSALEQAREADDSHIVRATAERALEVDPDRFRRQFTGAMDGGDQPLPGADRLNRQPDL